MDTQVLITVNGPGEVSNWLYPVASQLKAEMPEIKICVALMPCAFSSGAELSVVKSMPFVDASCGAHETKQIILRNRLPKGFNRPTPGLVLHLGGEGLLTWLVAKRMQQLCFAYVEKPFSGQSLFEKVFHSNLEASPMTTRSKNSIVVGDLMVDATWMRHTKREVMQNERPIVGIYPGSRDRLAKYILPFFAAIADAVSQSSPEIEWQLAKSEFLPMEFLRNVPDVAKGRRFDGENVTYLKSQGKPALVTKRGTLIQICSPLEVAANANLALTIPGSNTAELAILGIPMVVALPTWWGELAPLPGVAEYIGGIPLVGKYIKRALAEQYLSRLSYVAHPNRRRNKMIVPEVIGNISSRNVAPVVLSMLRSDNTQMQRDLISTMGPPGATKLLINELTPYLRRR